MDFGSILPTIENLSKLLPVRMIDDNQQGIMQNVGKVLRTQKQDSLYSSCSKHKLWHY